MHLPEGGFNSLTHYLFRYPAKFHPPVVRTLIERFTQPGDVVLDPFCGSGTLLVEAAVAGRHCIGTDIDPLAVFVARVKTHVYNDAHLRRSAVSLLERVSEMCRTADECARRQFDDITLEDMSAVLLAERLWIPEIPNLLHWFRRYVIIDLSRIRKIIAELPVPQTHIDFFLVCFASVIRAASNADPVPVSGLEVTAHMRRKEAAGRIINASALFASAVKKRLEAVAEFGRATLDVRTSVRQIDATKVRKHIRTSVDAVITSPPYHNAVDYYRRHQLEMFWLGLTETQQQRLTLRPLYIGRPQVSQRDPLFGGDEFTGQIAKYWYATMMQNSRERATAFRHYVIAMKKSLEQMANCLAPGDPAVLVVGHSSWKGKNIPTTDLITELGEPWFAEAERLWVVTPFRIDN